MADEGDLKRLIALYREAKDKLDKLNRNYREKKSQIDSIIGRIQSEILAYMNEHGLESVKTEAGSVSKVRKVTPRVEDWEAFYHYVHENKAYHLLQKRVAQGNTLEEMKEIGRMLPGVRVDSEYVVRVVKPQKKENVS